MSNSRIGTLALAFSGFLVVGATAASSRPSVAAAQRSMSAPGFLQPGECYRVALSIEGAPNFKVLELLDGGWIKAEVDAGSAKAQRQPVWVNSAQIVTIREARCSE